MPKRAVPACDVTVNGLYGDAQRDLRFHGGPDRAVTLFSLEKIEELQGEGHPIEVGTIGENLTLAEVDWAAFVPGRRVRVGEVLLELTKYASPCANIGPSFRERDFSRVAQKVNAGWSRLCARVIESGHLRVGDPVEVLAAPAEP